MGVIPFHGRKKFWFRVTVTICEGTTPLASHPEHELHLCASTQDDFDKWIQAINKVLQSCRQSNLLSDSANHSFNSKSSSTTTASFNSKSSLSTAASLTTSIENVPV